MKANKHQDERKGEGLISRLLMGQEGVMERQKDEGVRRVGRGAILEKQRTAGILRKSDTVMCTTQKHTFICTFRAQRSSR